MYEKAMFAKAKKEKKLARLRQEREQKELDTLQFNKRHSGKSFHPKAFIQNQQRWLKNKEKKCEDARLEKLMGGEEFSFQPNTRTSSSAEKKRNALAQKSRERAQQRKAAEIQQLKKVEDLEKRRLLHTQQQKAKQFKQQARRAATARPYTCAADVRALPTTPRQRRIETSKQRFVKSFEQNDTAANISQLLVNVENLFVEAKLVFQQCKNDSKQLSESMLCEKELRSPAPVVRTQQPSKSARKVAENPSWDLI